MAAATVPFVTVAEYLSEAYEPDVDYVDGVLEDRNVGELDHARIQRALLFALAKHETHFGYFVVQELRVQISKTRYRVPDTCLLSNDHLTDQIAIHPPLLCIEVLSPDDRFARVRAKCQDYLRLGVPEVWIFDPESRTAFTLRGDTMTEHRSGSIQHQSLGLELSLGDVFGTLDSK
jgi:Uma2 family endonuclease